MEERDAGILVNSDALLHRQYFNEMCNLLGIQVLYRSPKPGKTYDNSGELDSFYNAPIVTGCIFEDHPSQWTMKKLGWVSELQEDMSLIHVPYDLPGIQVGALFVVPSGLDHAAGRVFRVIKMRTSMLYPSSIACQIAPLYTSNFDRGQIQHKDNDFNLLKDDSEGYVL